MSLQSVSNSLRLRECYYMVLRHKVYFLGAVAFAMSIALILSFVLPKTYRAETILLVQEEKILNPLISSLAISPRVSDRMKTLREELLSWQRLTLLVEKLELDKGVKTPYEYENLMKQLRARIGIKMRGFDIITVSFEGPDPKKAQEIVKTLSDIIVEGNLTSQTLEADHAMSFIEGQMESYRDKLETSETNLREFKEVYSSTLPVAVRMNEQLVALKMELNHLLVENTPAHPRVIETKELIEHLESQRDEQIKNAEEVGMNIDPATYAKLVSSVPYQEQQLARLHRDYNVNATIYQTLLQKLETARISQTLEQSDKGTKFRVLEPARLPLKPAKPNKPLILLGGLILGIGMGSVLIYILELSDDSLRTVEEARYLLELPILGSIMTIRPEQLIAQERLRKAVSV